MAYRGVHFGIYLRRTLLVCCMLCTAGASTDAVCPPKQFKCKSDGKCIKQRWFCDGEKDCRDGSDEVPFDQSLRNVGLGCRSWKHISKVCMLPFDQSVKANHLCNVDAKCLDHNYKCLDGEKCIGESAFCDGVADCSDKSDEILYDPMRHTGTDGISCRSFTNDDRYCLLPRNQVGKREDFCRKDAVCSSRNFRCVNKLQCVWKDSFCDGDYDCWDRSDDILYDPSKHTEKDGIPCKGWLSQPCLLPSEYVCDGIFHCKDRADECQCERSKLFCNGVNDCESGIDECFCGKNNTRIQNVYSDKNCFRCLDDSKIIPNSKVCDGVVNCGDLSDECICGAVGSSYLHPLCDRIISGKGANCSGKLRCPRKDSKEPCLELHKICDGRLDCRTGIDELYCDRSEYACTTDRKAHRTGVPRCDFTCRFQRGRSAIRCDGKPTCNSLDEECLGCPNPPHYCNFTGSVLRSFKCKSGSHVPGYKVCDGIAQCPDEEDELYCPGRFYCKNSTSQHIPEEKICDLVDDCEDSSDELDCATSSHSGWGVKQFTHFYCNDSGEKKYIDWQKQVCDGNSDCASGIDECQGCTKGIFSDDNTLISSKALVPFLWVLSIIAVFGNVLVIYHSISSLTKSTKRKASVLQKSQHVLILNLAMADFFVGIYTASMCVLNIKLSWNGYCRIDQDWRSGNGCSALGVILMTGSEQSVFALTIITAFRLKSVIRPFAPHSIRLISFCMAISWVLACTLAVIPLAGFARDSFVESIWYANNPIVTRIDRKNVHYYIGKFMNFEKVNSSWVEDNGGGSWDVMEALIRYLNPDYIPARRFGYYSSHGVCLPRLFPDPQEHGSWGFSISIIFINFASFIFIFAGYVAIYIKSTQKRRMTTAISLRASSLQKNITRIVLTDFLCWMPICIMALLELSGVKIPVEAYVPVGTILIPINSAINPFLYSGAPDWLWQRLEPYVGRIRSRLGFKEPPGVLRKNLESSPIPSTRRTMTTMNGRSLRLTEFAVVETPM